MPRIRRILASLLVMLAAPAALRAQTGTIVGSVVDAANNRPLGSAQVFIPGTNIGSLTGQTGRFALTNVPPGTQTVRILLIGFAQQDQSVNVTPGASTEVSIRLQSAAVSIEGLVVTALGMERQARTLGVATQTLTGNQITRTEANLVNGLSGKIAGVHITNSGPEGGSSRIVIRGERSITGSNQPLFIVDGVPIDNSVGNREGVLTDQGGFDYGNAVQDINPDLIETMTVLKGPNAAALYGSRATNGAIIIETKKGRNSMGGGEIVASQTVMFEDELRLPKYQNVYGQGLFGEFSWLDGADNGVNDGEDQSWGPPLDKGLMIPQWNSKWVNGKPEPLPWVSHPNNIDQFFDVGTTSTTDVSVAGSNDRLHGRGSFSHMQLNGMTPGMKLKREQLSFAGGIQATRRLGVEASGQYIKADGEHRPGTGYGEDNFMSQFIWFGRQIDMGQLKTMYNQVRPAGDSQEGQFYNWNLLFHVNPYFEQLSNTNQDGRDRLIGQISANYNLNSWLTASVRTGTDWYQDDRLKAYAANPQIDISGYYTTNPLDFTRENFTANGAFGDWKIGFQETNSDFLLAANPKLGLPFTTSFTFGGNRRDVSRKQDYVWVSELATPGTYNVGNAAVSPKPISLISRKRVNSLYGAADLGFRDYLFLTLTGRNDWSSTLPEQNRSYFYPSVSGSFILSDAIAGLRGSGLSYAKLRASWARVGNDTDPYRLHNTYQADEKWAGTTPSFTIPSRLENPNLRPEITESIEVGTELAVLENRLGLDLTAYREDTRDQIMEVQVSRATGYQSQYVNAGKVRNEGVEVLLRGIPVQGGKLRWETTATWAKNRGKVIALAPGVQGLEISRGDFWGVTLYARQGEPLGQLMGKGYQRDPQGNIVISPTSGRPLATAAPIVIGNANPDWRASISNELTIGTSTHFNFLFDMKRGGDIFSVTNMWGRYSGVLQETVAGRCTRSGPELPGYPACTAETGIIAKGVNRVVTGKDTTYVPNTKVVDSENYWMHAYTVPESDIVDGTYVKLREVTLAYDLPLSVANQMRVQSVSLSLTGRNLWLWSKAVHIDPETAMESSNVQGFEYGQMPSTRSFGLNVTIRP